MTPFKTTLALAAVSSIAIASGASAQTAAPATITAGPPIAGLCTISVERAVATSAVGLSIKTRLEQLNQQANAEVNSDRMALQSEQAAIQQAAQAKSQPEEQLKQRAEAWGQKYELFQRKVQQRAQELQATQAKQFQRVEAELDPIVKSIYSTRRCSVLISADAVVANLANPQMDITQDSITQLNAKITTLAFDREHLDQQQAPVGASSAPVSAAPAAAAPHIPAKKKK